MRSYFKKSSLIRSELNASFTTLPTAFKELPFGIKSKNLKTWKAVSRFSSLILRANRSFHNLLMLDKQDNKPKFYEKWVRLKRKTVCFNWFLSRWRLILGNFGLFYSRIVWWVTYVVGQQKTPEEYSSGVREWETDDVELFWITNNWLDCVMKSFSTSSIQLFLIEIFFKILMERKLFAKYE